VQTRSMHPLVRELVALLPGDGEPFPDPARKRWVVAIEAAVELLYGEGDDAQPQQQPARARHRALPATETDLMDAGPGDFSDDRRFADYEVRYPGENPGEHSTGPPEYRAEYSNGASEPAAPFSGAAHSGDQPEYFTEYRTDIRDTHGNADADESWRHSAERAVGSTYSSYTWDTSSP
jgi:hypothetical protein